MMRQEIEEKDQSRGKAQLIFASPVYQKDGNDLLAREAMASRDAEAMDNAEMGPRRPEVPHLCKQQVHLAQHGRDGAIR